MRRSGRAAETPSPGRRPAGPALAAPPRPPDDLPGSRPGCHPVPAGTGSARQASRPRHGHYRVSQPAKVLDQLPLAQRGQRPAHGRAGNRVLAGKLLLGRQSRAKRIGAISYTGGQVAGELAPDKLIGRPLPRHAGNSRSPPRQTTAAPGPARARRHNHDAEQQRPPISPVSRPVTGRPWAGNPRAATNTSSAATNRSESAIRRQGPPFSRHLL